MVLNKDIKDFVIQDVFIKILSIIIIYLVYNA